MSRRILLNLAVFLAVFGVMCVWAVRNVVTFDAIERPYELDVDLAGASGIAPNAEVAYLGVNYGRVGDVELVTGGVRATLKIDDGRRIPRGSVARIFRKSAIGEPYIDFQPPEGFDHEGAGDADYYEPGDTVPLEDTRNPIEFSELLRTASRLLSTIDPERAGTLLHELALALDGRGEDLRDMTESMDRLASTFAARTDALDRLAVNNTRLTSVLADHRGSLGQSLSDLAAVGESLRSASGDTQVLLDRGAALLGELGGLVGDTRPALDCILDDLAAINSASARPERLAGLAHHLEVGPLAYGLLASTADGGEGGPWVRVNIQVATENPATQHQPPLALPTPPVVEPCPATQSSSAAAVTSGDETDAATPATAQDFRPQQVLPASRSHPLATRAATVASWAAVLAGSGLLVTLARRRLGGR